MTTLYACPFNYIGGKSKLLPVLIPILSQESEKTFVDLFGGGFSVGINVPNASIIYNDINTDMTNLIQTIQHTDFTDFEYSLNELINKYKLSKTNTDGYMQLRNDFNESRNSMLFCLLIFYSFNHQIRYNNELKFNTPFGRNRSSYNPRTQKNLENFFEIIHSKKVKYSSLDFNKVNIPDNAIVYIDPPYLVTTGSYNDGNRGVSSWNTAKEIELYRYIDKLNNNNIPFVLSNMLKKGDYSNTLLDTWKKQFNSFTVQAKYKNYHRKNHVTEEIIVTNISINHD